MSKLKYTFILILFFSHISIAEIDGGLDTPPTLDFPTEAILRIGVPLNPQMPACTATRVSQNILLTAAHCLKVLKEGFQINSQIRFLKIIEKRTLIDPEQVNPHHDLALVLYEPSHGERCPPVHPLGEKGIIRIHETRNKVSYLDPLYFAGYGAKKIDLTKDNKITILDDSRKITFATVRPEFIGLLSSPLTINTKLQRVVGLPGDSGSAAIQKINGVWQIVGVLSELDFNHAKDPELPYLENHFSPLSTQKNSLFIKSKLKELEQIRDQKRICAE